jgi:hypothetical protein
MLGAEVDQALLDDRGDCGHCPSCEETFVHWTTPLIITSNPAVLQVAIAVVS